MPYLQSCPSLGFSLIYAPLSTVEQQIQRSHTRALKRGEVSLAHVPFDLNDPAFGPPSHIPPVHRVFFRSAAWRDGTVFKANAADGAYGLMYQLSIALGCKVTRWVLSQPTVPADWQENLFGSTNRADPREDGRIVSVTVNDNGRWEFSEHGPVQWFETVSNYQRRRIQDRLTPSILIEYLERQGIPVESDAFWSSDASMLLMQSSGA
jgi:hypothetical protein